MTFLSGLRKFRLVPSMLFAGVLITACATAPTRPPAPISSGQPRPDVTPTPEPTPEIEPTPHTPTIPVPGQTQRPMVDRSKYVTPPHMVGRDVRRIAVLLPFSHSSSSVREQASGLLAAIEMAMFDQGNDDILLLPKDTAGDARKAAQVTKEVIDEGADVIIGPLFAESVRASASIAREDKIPLLAFSNDRSAAGGGAFLMSFPPEEEVSRVVDWAVLNGVNRFAFIGPDNTYSRRVETALRFEAARRGGAVIGAEFYDPSDNAPVDDARAISDRIKLVLNQGVSKVAVMIPDRGVRLRGVAPLLPYYGVSLRRLQYIGTSLWEDPDIWREPVLENAAYATQSPEDTRLFQRGFSNVYGRQPTSLSSLGYDAAALAIAFLDDGVVTEAEITDYDGFRGVNGLFRFRSDGTIERGLAVMSVQASGPTLLDEAATDFRPSVN